MLDKEFDYYKNHQEVLVRKYKGKFIAIIGDKVIEVYDSELEAYNAMKAKYDQGTFLIQHCLPGTASYTQTFHSGIAFTA